MIDQWNSSELSKESTSVIYNNMEELEDIMLDEINQMQKQKAVFSYLHIGAKRLSSQK